MKKILAGCMAALMICGTAMAEAPGALRDQINAAASGQTASAESVSVETTAQTPEDFMVPQAVPAENTTETVNETTAETTTESTQGRKPGELMGSIQSGTGVTFTQQEQTSIGIIGGQDGPTAVFVATPEEPTAEPEAPVVLEAPVATEAPVDAETSVPGVETFVLRDSITWASTKDEVIATFDSDVIVEEAEDNDLGAPMEYVDAWTVPVSSFEGEMLCYFHEDQLWTMIYWIDLEEADLNRLIAALDSKYGANVPGGEVYESILSPLAEDFYDDYDDYMGGDFYNWTGPENTQIVLMNNEGECGLYYFNGNYIPTLHEAVASKTASLFGI